MRAATALVLAQLAQCGAVGLNFAFHKGRLFTSIENQNGFAGDMMVIAMLQLEHFHGHEVPDVYGSVEGGLTNDFAHGDFSHWREPGTTESILLPDYDYWGDVSLHIPPLPLMMRVFDAEMPAWSERAQQVFWTGNGMNGGHGRQVRADYIECAKAHPREAVVSTVAWGRNTGFVHSQHVRLKDAQSDLRKLQRFTHLPYFCGTTWSMSYKRILVAGGAVFADADNQHETFFTQLMEGCTDCLLYYNASDVCASLLAQARADSDAEARAKRLHSHVSAQFRPESVRRGMVQALREHAARVNHTFDLEEGGEALRIGTRPIRTLRRTVCLGHLKQLLDKVHPADKWQLMEWYDMRTCDFAQAGTDYLRFVAV